jgi:hypothetical protein
MEPHDPEAFCFPEFADALRAMADEIEDGKDDSSPKCVVPTPSLSGKDQPYFSRQIQRNLLSPSGQAVRIAA